jgi:hypothetical protein
MNSIKNSTSITTRRIRRFIPFATIVAAAALMVAPASGSAAIFGSELTPETQPSNAGDGHACAPVPGTCTWAMNEAYGRPDGGERSPLTGKLKKVRLIAQVPGSFRLQIVSVKPDNSAKVVRQGPTISYQGQPAGNLDTYTIETFPVKVAIKKGQRLAIKTSNNSLVRCSSGGDNSLLYTPPLAPGAGYRATDADDGCWLLLEGVVKKGKNKKKKKNK